jgi:hypothetical protein
MMAIRVNTGFLQNLSEKQRMTVENKLLQSVLHELGAVLPPDWTQVTFSRIGPPHEPVEE